MGKRKVVVVDKRKYSRGQVLKKLVTDKRVEREKGENGEPLCQGLDFHIFCLYFSCILLGAYCLFAG